MTRETDALRRAPLSITLALDALREQCEQVAEAERAVVERRAIRDALIRDAMASGISYRRLSAITGLSQNRLWRISINAQEETSA